MNSNFIFETSPITYALGWTIVHSLWQAAIIGLVLKLVLSLFSNQLSNLRYLTSCLALTLCIAWTGWTFQQEWQSYQKQESITFEASTEPFQNAQFIDNELTNKPFLTIGGLAQWKNVVKDYIPIIVFCWFLGVLFFAYCLLQGFLRLYQLQRKGLYPTPNEWQGRLTRLCKQMGIAKSVELLISNKIDGPVTFRFFKPVILLPIQLFTGLSTTQIEVLLLHELAHIRRLDYGVNLVQSTIEVLLFYHPIIWWINHQIRIEREHCCDDLVLQIQNNPHVYAHVLTNAQTKYSLLKTNLTMSANQKRGLLTTRIHRLFGKYEYSVASMKGVFMALFLVTVFLVQEISAQRSMDVEMSTAVSLVEESVGAEMNETVTLAKKGVDNETNEAEISAKNTEDAITSMETEETKAPKNSDVVLTEKSKSTVEANSKEEQMGDVFPKNAVPGKCYQAVKGEKVYGDVSKEYLVYTGDAANLPKEATKMVLEITPATTKWVKKKASGSQCMSENPEDCKVWCLTDIPAETKELWVLNDETQSNQFERKTIKTSLKKERTEWLEVSCENKLSQLHIIQIQRALQSKSYDAGNNGLMDLKFFDGLTQFQEANNLPIGKLDAHIMMLLGLEY